MTEDEDDVVRLVLMDMQVRSFVWFSGMVRELCGRHVTIIELQEAWEKYMGMDGRTLPTHSIETGGPLRLAEDGGSR